MHEQALATGLFVGELADCFEEGQAFDSANGAADFTEHEINFICTSIALTVIAASNSSDSSVLDRLGGTAPTATEEQTDAPAGSDLLPPSSSDAPLVPSAN